MILTAGLQAAPTAKGVLGVLPHVIEQAREVVGVARSQRPCRTQGWGFLSGSAAEGDLAGAHGVIGDRAYALREASSRIVTAKKWPFLLECSARYDAPPTPGALAPLRITLPDGRTIQACDQRCAVS
jgi:hypothetical protein